MILSICIPTYNRAYHLQRCLTTVSTAIADCKDSVEVCISDNGSTDCTQEVIKSFKNDFRLISHKNKENLGVARNIVKSIEISSGEFIWLVGDDDLMPPNSICDVVKLIDANADVDFFYLNAYHLHINDLELCYKNGKFLDELNTLKKFSNYPRTSKLKFHQLISPKISFDFLGGMFLSAFRKSLWLRGLPQLNDLLLRDQRQFSSFDNTFPHVKVWAYAFKDSDVYFSSRPHIICLSGVREWTSLYPLISSVRLPEALDVYRASGLGLARYIRSKNYALRNFFGDMVYLYRNRETLEFPIFIRHQFYKNWMFPAIYYSVFRYILKCLRNTIKR